MRGLLLRTRRQIAEIRRIMRLCYENCWSYRALPERSSIRCGGRPMSPSSRYVEPRFALGDANAKPWLGPTDEGASNCLVTNWTPSIERWSSG